MRHRVSLVGVLLVMLAIFAASRASATNPSTLVYLNGNPAHVYFNDGDSFRVLDGMFANTKSRLEGFNTLESFGPVHSWGTWNPHELWIIAKMATLNSRQGVWHCTSPDLHRDGYGRILWTCPDLGVDLVSKGLAHVMSVTDAPGRIEYIRAQRQAIAAHRGMWAHGVPDFVLTSVHSLDEDPGREQMYNRVISTVDGHTEPWSHHDHYETCSSVCAHSLHIDEARVEHVALALRADAQLAPRIADIDNLYLANLVGIYARRGTLPDWTPEALVADLTTKLSAAKARGEFGEMPNQETSCQVYVPFDVRYAHRPPCLEHP